MDHSWGRMVGEMGLGSTGATLCTRVDDGGLLPRFITNEELYGIFNPGGIYARIWIILPDTVPDWKYQDARFIKLAEHFPYGLQVVPDVPL